MAREAGNVIVEWAGRSAAPVVQFPSSSHRAPAEPTREERALRIVAVAAGTAFGLGIVLRVWSNRHE